MTSTMTTLSPEADAIFSLLAAIKPKDGGKCSHARILSHMKPIGITRDELIELVGPKRTSDRCIEKLKKHGLIINSYIAREVDGREKNVRGYSLTGLGKTVAQAIEDVEKAVQKTKARDTAPF